MDQESHCNLLLSVCGTNLILPAYEILFKEIDMDFFSAKFNIQSRNASSITCVKSYTGFHILNV